MVPLDSSHLLSFCSLLFFNLRQRNPKFARLTVLACQSDDRANKWCVSHTQCLHRNCDDDAHRASRILPAAMVSDQEADFGGF